MRCEIDDARILLQVVQDRRNPLDVLREALSNSWDARANRATVVVRSRSRTTLDIEIHDNGNGIQPKEFRSFFGLGFSDKEGKEAVGNKGLGTKLFFNSDRLEVATRLPSGAHYNAILQAPLEKLKSGQVPSFTLRETEAPTIMYSRGTSVLISGFRAASHSSTLTAESVANYLRWFTVAGSCRSILGLRESRPFRVRLIRIGTRRVEYNVFGHELPGEQGSTNSEYNSFAMKFQPFSVKLRDDEGGQLGCLEVAGAIVGPDGHVVTDKRVKKRYKGVFLAKDYFVVKQVNNEVFGGTGEWQNVHVIANCQDLRLSMNRDEFLNTGSSSAYDEAISALRTFANAMRRGDRFRYRGMTVETGSRFAGALYLRLKALRARELQLDQNHLKALDLVSFVGSSPTVLANDGGPAYEPSNSMAVMLTFQALITKHQTFSFLGEKNRPTRFRVLGYSTASGGHLVVQSGQGRKWSEPLFFKPIVRLKELKPAQLTKSDGVVCWDAEGVGPDRYPRSSVIVLGDVIRRNFGASPR